VQLRQSAERRVDLATAGTSAAVIHRIQTSVRYPGGIWQSAFRQRALLRRAANAKRRRAVFARLRLNH
jgi:hypothetical protein